MILLNFNDNDTGNRDKQIIWNSYDEQAWQYPNRFGQGKLIKEEKPDLRIVDIKWKPENAKKGDKLEFAAEIINQGTAATPDGVVHRVVFQIDEENLFWSDQHIDSIAPGESVIVQADGGQDGLVWLLTEGQHIITASIDNQDKIEELDDANNDFKVQINLD